MKLALRALVVSLLAGPALAGARPAVVVPGVKGDRGALTRQLRSAVCASLECVPRERAYTGTQPDYAKARRNGVAGIVFGAITAKGSSRQLWLGLYTRSRTPDQTWSIPLDRKGLAAAPPLAAAVADIERRLAPPPSPAPRPAPRPPVADRGDAPAARAPVEVPAPAPAPAPRAAPPPPPLPPPPPAARMAEPAVDPSARSGTAAPARIPPGPAGVPPARPPATPPTARPRWVAVELGAYVTQRRLTYSGTTPGGSSPLMEMTADAIVCPAIGLEVYPAAGSPGALSGLGAFGAYRRSVGFKVKDPTQEHAAQLSQLRAGLLWRLPPLTGLRLALSPEVSYESRDFTVTGGIAGLPDAHLRGVRGGIGLAAPVTPRVALLLDAGYVRWTSSKELVKGDVAFFPSGSAGALEVDAGLSLALGGPLSARVLAEYSSTSYSLDADPTGAYRASGAKDAYLGLRALVRAEF